MGKIKDYTVEAIKPSDKVTVSDADTGETKNVLASDFAGAVNSSTVVYDNTDSGLTATNVQDAIDEVVSSIESPYLIYTALLTQTGTSAPVATILGNNTIGTIVWTRVGIGEYVGTLASAFNTADTAIILGANGTQSDASYIAYVNDTNTIHVRTFTLNNGDYTSFSASDEWLWNTFIEIRRY